MHRPLPMLLLLVALSGCAAMGRGTAGTPGGGAEAPRPGAVSAPEAVGAAELGALTITRPTGLRQEPTGGARPFGALKQGEIVLHLDARGPWYRVWVPAVALSGWIEKGTAAQAKVAPSPAAPPVPVNELVLVTAAKTGARLRQGPSTKAATIRSLERGEPLRLLRRQGAWARVWDPATKGTAYISVRLVERPR